MKNKDLIRICWEGFVEVLHFEGGGEESFSTYKWRGFVGKGRIAFWKDDFEEASYPLISVWERIALHFREKRLTPSLPLAEKDLSHGEGFVKRDSYAFRGEEKAWLIPHVGKDLQGRIAMHLRENPHSFPLWEEPRCLYRGNKRDTFLM